MILIINIMCQNFVFCAVHCYSEKGAVFGAPLTEEGIARIYQLIEYLSKREFDDLHVKLVLFC